MSRYSTQGYITYIQLPIPVAWLRWLPLCSLLSIYVVMAVKFGINLTLKTMGEKIEILKKKALSIMSFSDSSEPSSPLFKE